MTSNNLTKKKNNVDIQGAFWQGLACNTLHQCSSCSKCFFPCCVCNVPVLQPLLDISHWASSDSVDFTKKTVSGKRENFRRVHREPHHIFLLLRWISMINKYLSVAVTVSVRQKKFVEKTHTSTWHLINSTWGFFAAKTLWTSDGLVSHTWGPVTFTAEYHTLPPHFSFSAQRNQINVSSLSSRVTPSSSSSPGAPSASKG